MEKVKITVLKKEFYEDLAEEYLTVYALEPKGPPNHRLLYGWNSSCGF